MTDSTRVMRRPRRAWPAGVRTATAIAAGVLALLTASCSGTPSSAGSGASPNAAGSTAAPSAVSYSGCMRSTPVNVRRMVGMRTDTVMLGPASRNWC